MADIVERLRSAHLSSGIGTLMHEAADAIERLRAALQELRGVAFHNDVLHPPNVIEFIDRALEPEP